MALTYAPPAGIEPKTPPSRTSALLSRIKGMLLAPKAEWSIVARESTPTVSLLGYVMPFAALASVLVLAYFLSTARIPRESGLILASLAFGFELVGVYAVAIIINALASFFGAVPDQRKACMIAVYAFTPVWIATLFIPIPAWSLPLKLLAGAYHSYLLYLGLQVLMQPPRDRAVGYAATVVLCSVFLRIVFMLVSSGLAGTDHLSPCHVFG